MNGKPYVVWILAKTYVETSVAVIAKSEEDATRMALRGVSADTVNRPGFAGDSNS